MKKLNPFRLEEYLATREFNSKFMFCGSDLESRSIQDILNLASPLEQEEFFNLSLAYTTPLGHKDLRKEIALQYKNINADQVLCFAGAEEAIYTASLSLLTEKDHVICIVPCYQSLKSVAQSICDVSTVEIKIKDGAWFLDLEKISQCIRKNTRMLFVNFPHNPTGFTPDLETFKKLIELCKQNKILLFSDEVYRGISLEDSYLLPSASELYDKALSLGVMSKAYGLAGLRIGWVVCQDAELLTKLSNFKHYLSICNSAPSEWLSLQALRARSKILNENNQLVRSNYKKLKNYFLQNKDLFSWTDPQGGCIAFPQYIGKGKIYEIADTLREKTGVVILPDWVYEQDKNHFRVGFGRKNCMEALKLFSQFFSEK